MWLGKRNTEAQQHDTLPKIKWALFVPLYCFTLSNVNWSCSLQLPRTVAFVNVNQQPWDQHSATNKGYLLPPDAPSTEYDEKYCHDSK